MSLPIDQDTYPEDDDVDLSSLEEHFAQAASPDDPVADGEYAVRIQHVNLRTTRTTGKPMLSWRLRLADSPYAGRCIWRHQVLTPHSVPWLKHDNIML